MRPIRSEARDRERGIVILLVAVVLLFVVGAMAALSIDVVTFYTARSEAQLAADAAALAGARVLANSGMTSDLNAKTDGLMTSAETLARTVATQLASGNQVGGKTLNSTGACGALEISVCFNDGDPAFTTNPHVTVQINRNDVPTFFARIWGRGTVTVQASATAEAYNPSGASALTAGTVIPVAPSCVKPIVLPNLSPNGGSIINPVSGAIVDAGLVGENLNGTPLRPLCNVNQCKNSTLGPGLPQAWNYYPGDYLSSFPPPTTGLPACAAGFNPYQESISGCVQTPIVCGSTVNLEASHQGLRNDTDNAINCLTNALTGTALDADSVNLASGPPNGVPFQFLAGAQNPLVQAGTISPSAGVLVSDSVATIPIYNSAAATPPTTVTVIGFLQLFLNSTGTQTSPGSGQTITTVVNIAGCGTTATGQPILGNGASPVPVRLIAGP